MDFQELLHNRHAVKHFDGTPVPLEDVKEIVAEATLAPSGINIQSWHFVFVQSPEAKAALLEHTGKANQEQVATSGGVLLIFADPRYADRLGKIAEQAKDQLSDLDYERFSQRYQAYVNTFSPEYLNSYMSWTTGFVAMNLLYAIYDKGYKANVVLGFDRSLELNKALGVDEHLRADLMVPFGSSTDTGAASFRLGLDDVFEVK